MIRKHIYIFTRTAKRVPVNINLLVASNNAILTKIQHLSRLLWVMRKYK